LNYQLSLRASSQTEFKSFAQSKKEIMDETDTKASEWLQTWCARFPNITKTNINIVGGAGSGKTFLLECVANELIKKGVVVSYKTAFEINELARLYHMGKSFDFSDCLNVDVLLIDDLGTEPVLKNVTKEYLYNLINTRQINNKATLISTNLSLENILDRYDERIFSRLANKNLSTVIQLVSQDKRLK
jgi:DNA replication protein DnaC